MEPVVIIDAKNTLTRIDRIWCFVSVDPDDGCEGVLSGPLLGPGSQVPLIAADEKRLDSLWPWARMIAKALGRPCRLIKLHSREVVEEFGP